MSAVENRRLANFSLAVRESTIKRLRLVPEGLENWRPATEALSFAEIARHLIAADGWLEKKLEDPDLEPITGDPESLGSSSREEFLDLITQLQESGERRSRLIRSLSEDHLDRLIPDKRFGGEVSVWWLVVRGNLDHEIHHRGQVAAYLAITGKLPHP